MHYRRLLFAWPLGFFACISNTPAPGTGSDVDASFAEDAAVPGVDSPAPQNDAPAPSVDSPAPVEDAAADAPVDAGPGPLTVIVAGPGGLESGIPVVWSDATGAVVGSTVTGTDGVAVNVAPNVAMVTVLMGTATNPWAYTVQAVVPGQTVLVEDVSGSSNLSANVSVPSTPTLGDGSALQYSIKSGTCGGEVTSPFEISLVNNDEELPCIGLAHAGTAYEEAFPLLVEATDSTGALLGYAFSKTNAVTSADDAGLVDVALANPWQTATTTQTLALANLDAGGVSTTVTYSEVADDVATPLQTQVVYPTDGGPAGAPFVYTHPGFADTVQVEAILGSFDGIAATAVVTASLPPTTSETVTIDMTPASSAPLISGSNEDVSTAQPVISWTLSSGSFASATAIVAMATWSAPADGGGNQYGTWTIVSPGTSGTSVKAPALPAALANIYAPLGGAQASWQTIFGIDGQTAVPTYAAAVQMASQLQAEAVECGVPSPLVPTLPGLGTAVVAFYSNGGGC